MTSALAGVAAPASADVTVDPPSAAQGSGVNLTFRVTNEHPASALTKVVLTLPRDQPVADVYPLSVDDWAPQLTSRTVNPPVQSVHGSLISTATSSVTWTAMPGREVRPGGTAELSVAIGPMPATSTMSFSVQARYADGSTGPASADPAAAERVTLALTPAGAAPPPHGHQPVEADPGVQPAPRQDSGVPTTMTGVLGWIVAALCAAFGLGSLLRDRRRVAGAAQRAAAPARPPRQKTAAQQRTAPQAKGAPRAKGTPKANYTPKATAGPQETTAAQEMSARPDQAAPEQAAPDQAAPEQAAPDQAAPEKRGQAERPKVTAWSYRDGS